MAAQTDAGLSKYLYRSNNMPSIDPVTYAFWVCLDTNTNTFTYLLTHGASNGVTHQAISTDSDGRTLRHILYGPGGVNGGQMNIGQWHWLAYVRNGSSHKLYLDGVLSIDRTTAYSPSNQSLLVGGGFTVCNARFAALKIWNVALTEEQVLQERFTYRPATLGDLCEWHPQVFGDYLGDYSGNGRSLVENGTLAQADGPPISWGA